MYGKETLLNSFENKATYHPDGNSSKEVLKAAKNAVILSDLAELDHLAAALETRSKYGIRSQAECITYIRAMEGRFERKGAATQPTRRRSIRFARRTPTLSSTTCCRRRQQLREQPESKRAARLIERRRRFLSRRNPAMNNTRATIEARRHADGDPYSIERRSPGSVRHIHVHQIRALRRYEHADGVRHRD